MGAVNTTYTFTATDTITSTKMNDIIDQTTFTNDAVFDTTLAVASGKLKVNSQGITSNEIAANAVITSKIADANVTTVKIADSNVTTVKIADANVTPEKLSQPLTLATAKPTTSGNTVEFTGVPSWVKRITMIFNGVSTNGMNNVDLQIGSGSYSTIGYESACTFVASLNDNGISYFGGGFGIIIGANSGLCYGKYTIDLIGNNKYIGSGVFFVHQVGTAYYTMQSAGSSPTLTGPMDRIRIKVVGGSEVFDSGSINIMYE